ncbi:PilZ domain-containing protein [Syntrophus gentianae]|uniref:PilZ domain-containing protein n=1 Tax=Syntrophus gentianae TaxID=43775 RepID=A0A1H7WXW1_9BACT|nr:PilZ domain-containing protein [Syntrophus gentianae]SEM26456.1 PilZ domain-containing protein [Syntrophus gentianae]
MEKDNSELNKRKFSRVDAYLPIAYRLVPAEEQNYIQAEIFDPIYVDCCNLPETNDQALQACLNLLNAKLDSILHLLTLRNEGFSSLPSRLINISGAGLRLTTSEKFANGDILEIKTFLSPQKNRALRLYGKVIGIEEQQEGYQTSLSFVQMDDIVRDEIVKFVFGREREILREKRRI